MPLVHNEGADLYWTGHGDGAPILLIMGLSFTHEMWYRLLPALDGFRVIRFDNRGMGRSTTPRGTYSIRQMARDSRAVLRADGHESAMVIGASMGGMIAQELALQYPEAVQRLILGCTSHSGAFGQWPDLSCIPWNARRPDGGRRDMERGLVRLLYSDKTPRERIEEDLMLRSNCRWSAAGFRRQFLAIATWSAYFRLPRLRVPTLVVHGADDRLVPVANGKALARRIPGALWHVIPDAGHVMATDQPEECARVMQPFLQSASVASN